MTTIILQDFLKKQKIICIKKFDERSHYKSYNPRWKYKLNSGSDSRGLWVGYYLWDNEHSDECGKYSDECGKYSDECGKYSDEYKIYPAEYDMKYTISKYIMEFRYMPNIDHSKNKFYKKIDLNTYDFISAEAGINCERCILKSIVFDEDLINCLKKIMQSDVMRLILQYIPYFYIKSTIYTKSGQKLFETKLTINHKRSYIYKDLFCSLIKHREEIYNTFEIILYPHVKDINYANIYLDIKKTKKNLTSEYPYRNRELYDNYMDILYTGGNRAIGRELMATFI